MNIDIFYQLKVLALSFVQGITEFLPISSQAHVIFSNMILNLGQDALWLDVALHVGSLGAICAYLRDDLRQMVIAVFDLLRGRALSLSFNRIIYLAIATVPVVIIGFIVMKMDLIPRQSLLMIGVANLVFALLLLFADKLSPNFKTLEEMNALHALYLGLAQVLALIPGTSRSGVTMTAGRFLGYHRVEAARFSMLMAIPAIAGACRLAWYAWLDFSALLPILQWR